MSRKSVISIITALIMAFSVCIFIPQEVDAATSNQSLYWLKVNRKANVVTAYKLRNGKYVPYRAMVCSTGAPESKTPLMDTRIKGRWRWGYLFGDVWGQYCTHINGDYLFHSVYYKKENRKDTLVAKEYNKLGTGCSKGCIRLAVIDAKWIYENCSRGTRVTVYGDSYPGPLGKPEPLKVSRTAKWDPTDPDKRNPDFRLKKPVITIDADKSSYVQYRNKYTLKKYVTARNVNAHQDLTSSVTVYSVKRWDGSKWVKTHFTTSRVGKYKITYRVYSKYCGGAAYKSFTVNVIDTLAPKLKVPSERVVSVGETNAVKGVTAMQKSRSRTEAINVNIIEPDGTEVTMNYSEAKVYEFTKTGDYFVIYSVKNCYSPYRETTKKLTINCRDEFMATMDKFVNY